LLDASTSQCSANNCSTILLLRLNTPPPRRCALRIHGSYSDPSGTHIYRSRGVSAIKPNCSILRRLTRASHWFGRLIPLFSVDVSPKTELDASSPTNDPATAAESGYRCLQLCLAQPSAPWTTPARALFFVTTDFALRSAVQPPHSRRVDNSKCIPMYRLRYQSLGQIYLRRVENSRGEDKLHSNAYLI